MIIPHDAEPLPLDAHAAGWQACVDGCDDSENPYRYGTPEWDEWADGYFTSAADARAESRHRESLRYPGAP